MTSEQEYAARKAEHLSPMVRLGDEELKEKVGSTFSLLTSALDALAEQQATWKPDAEEWSAAQVCDHVALGTGMVANIIGLLARGQRPADQDWEPPARFKGDPADLAGIRDRLRALPRETAELLDGCLKTDRLDVTAENSFFGEMNWREWYCFLRVHVLAHVEQVEKLRAMPGFPN